MSILVRPPKRKLQEPDEGPRKHSAASSWSPGFRSLPVSRRASEQREAGDSHISSASLRELHSNRASPVLYDNGPLHTPRQFSPKASVVLIGIRGTGKSSLAVILAATTGRRLIDADRYFHQMAGCSRAVFKKDNDHAVYRQQEARIFESMLSDHQEDCVIACGAGSMERSGQQLLREFAQTHPVIHVTRDPESIQSYLKAWDTQKVRHFLELSGPIYRSCSNLEFFNLSETANRESIAKDGHDHSPGPRDQRSQTPTPFLTLKRVQRDFLRFIAFVVGDSTELSRQHASFPLTLLPVETRQFTSAVSVPFSVLCEKDLDIEELEFTVDAFELKIDVASPSDMGADSNLADRISQVVSTLRRNIIVPLMYHVESFITPRRSRSPAPASRTADESYLNLLRHGLRLAPGFLTVDLTRDDNIISQVVSARGTTKIVGHFETFHPIAGGWDGDEYMKLYERAKKLGCNVVRFCQPAETLEDNNAVQRFRHRIESLPGPQLPLIAYNTGPLGRVSRCFNPILTPVTHPSLITESPTQLIPTITARHAQEALFSTFALDPMQFFVFGANVTYSMSPAMHNTAFKLCGMPHHYSIFQSPTLRGLNELVENQFFGGSSVSLPYKTEVIPLLHSMSPHARAIGAVNTLIPIRSHEDSNDPRLSQESSVFIQKCRAGPIKGIHGDNTDWIGICNCIRRGLSPANAVRPSTTGLVIGSGGMARAAIYSMIHLGVQNIFVYNRTLANAEKLAQHYNRQDLFANERMAADGRPRVSTLSSLDEPWPAEYKQPTVVVSGIPAHSIGGAPAPNFNVPTQWLESPTGGVVVDLAYKPLNTPLMKQIRALSHRGWVALDGLDVLPEQGFAQFELFTGRRAPRRLMRKIVLQEYEDDEGHDSSAIRDRLQHLDGQPT
ncbi:hypothetical protein N7448_003566 [Penicillium atrosanguineum]|uniref:Quinate repressor protein n=1 Tax=Penicillium atrosanguineum TaxID=1132637 RepID=A0A9W9U609_9EURO|nr:uncharacterized protein N7443_002535 [Penicillium atrosanguineum]KAJ5122431.1 hypothetical protein N7526_009368 [Penicillium atrosanguineum]KAJ5140158.1 hypothetical protein N7448_003566 [Penicillium atrosanguineum]KAJ5310074.1 hypothetical protein N7443_002535 [Penicillium atrosanguineum]KAJ5315590.1 hypothetical protein N7476_005897 [Penicillium atrosanguineum]